MSELKTHPIKQLPDAACSRSETTHSETARRAGISRETLYRIMRGDGKRASVQTICAVARAAGVAPVALLRLMFHDLDSGGSTLLPVLHASDHISFLADVTIPDGATVLAGQRFEKTWALQNTGGIEWVGRRFLCMDADFISARWVVRRGRRMLVPDLAAGLVRSKKSILVPNTPSGGAIKISVTFRAPLLPCDTFSRWRMVDAAGKTCFPEHTGVWCAVSVVAI